MDTNFPTFRKLLKVRIDFSSWWPRYITSDQQRSLLRLIAVANEEHLTLSALITAWAADERGVYCKCLRRLAMLLQDGRPLPEAVEEIPGLLREEDVFAIRFGAQSGTLASTIRDRINDKSPEQYKIHATLRKIVLNFCIVLLLALFFLGFYQIKIAPVIQMIMRDYELVSPPTLEWLQYYADMIMSYWAVGVAAILAMIWCTFSSRPRRYIRRSVLGRFYQPLSEQRSADVLQKLSIAIQAGRPIAGALSTLARYHFDPMLRNKLLFVRNEVEHGADVWQSMTAVGLLALPEAQLLTTADRFGNCPWALKQLALCKQRKQIRKLERLAQLLLPTMIILLGLFVLYQALILIVPLAHLIQSLA